MARFDFAPTVMSVSSVDMPFRPLMYRADILKKLNAKEPTSVEELDKLLY